MKRALTLLLIASTGCFNAPRETEFPTGTGGGSAQNTGGGTSNGGGNATGGGSTAGGPGGGAAMQTADGDATCDQSTCLPSTGNIGPFGVRQLAQDADHLYALLDGPFEYTGSLIRIEKATGARRVLYRDDSNPIDPGVPLIVRGGHVYFGKTWAGEIWGVISRVPVAGGDVEELVDSNVGAGNPSARRFDVSGDTLLFTSGARLYRGTVKVTGTTQQLLHQADSVIRDVVIAGGDSWFLCDAGIFRIPLTAIAIDDTLSGSFHRLLVDGSHVYALRSDGAVIHVNGPNRSTPVANLPGSTQFARAGGSFYGVKTDATSATLVDATGVVLSAPRTMGDTHAAIDATRFYLGTDTTLAWKSTATPTATCGCGRTSPVIPGEAMACMRNVCPATTTFSRGMFSGAVDGAHLWGVFYESMSGARELVRYLQSGGGGLVFPAGNQLRGLVGVDTDSVYYVTSVGDVSATDKQGNAERPVASGVRYWSADEPAAALDATHVYYLATDGVRRVAKTGGTSELVVTDTAANQLRLDDTHVYFVSSGKLKRAPKGGGGAVVLAEDFAFEPGYSVAGSHVYFLTARGLERVRKTGDGFKTLVLAADKLADLPLHRMAVQGSDLLVSTAELSSSAGALWRLKLSDGSREKLLQLGAGHSPASVLVDAKGFALSSWQDTRWRERGCSCPAP